jgi:hypothetical protein
VAAHRLLLPDRAELGDVVRDAAEALRMRGLHVHEHVRRGDPALVLADVPTRSTRGSSSSARAGAQDRAAPDRQRG